MAIVQISRITNRKGLTDNLPQLAGAELGWCVDSRRLFIGNGTLEEGAPTIGNTEILTQFSDIAVLSSYIYSDSVVGYSAQTGPTVGDPIVRTVQAKLDDFADVRDFGAVGDGIADDTDAINRALYQLYCRDNNTQIRRSLYFPAGTYLTTEPIVIPTYAKLVGEGANCTIIYLNPTGSSVPDCVAQYGDSLQQTGINIGNNGATAPRNIEISSMTFQTTIITDVFLIDSAEDCYFDSVGFIGPFSQSDITDPGFSPGGADYCTGVAFNSTVSYVCNHITFDKCGFMGTAYGVNTTQEVKAITISNSKFDTLYQGVVLGESEIIDNGPTGVRVVHNMFDNVFAEGILFDLANLNASAHNIFYNVGNSIDGVSPSSAVVLFGNNNNVSTSDLFERSDTDALQFQRVAVTASGTATGGTQIQLGRYAREGGTTATLTGGASDQTILAFSSSQFKAAAVDYTIIRGSATRFGRLVIVPGPNDGSSQIQYTDDYTQTDDTGITLVATENLDTISLLYTASAGSAGSLTYSLVHLA